MLFSILAMTVLAAQTPHPSDDALEMLPGEWICRSETPAGGRIWRSETWQDTGTGLIVGEVVQRPEHAERRGAPRIASLGMTGYGAGLRLTLRPTEGAPVRYRFLRGDRQEVTFESTDGGSPHTISYRLTGGEKLTVTHGLADGRSKSWSYWPSEPAREVLSCDDRG